MRYTDLGPAHNLAQQFLKLQRAHGRLMSMYKAPSERASSKPVAVTALGEEDMHFEPSELLEVVRKARDRVAEQLKNLGVEGIPSSEAD